MKSTVIQTKTEGKKSNSKSRALQTGRYVVSQNPHVYPTNARVYKSPASSNSQSYAPSKTPKGSVAEIENEDIFDVSMAPIYTASFEIKVDKFIINRAMPDVTLSEEDLL